jgi:hypothetical protein
VHTYFSSSDGIATAIAFGIAANAIATLSAAADFQELLDSRAPMRAPSASATATPNAAPAATRASVPRLAERRMSDGRSGGGCGGGGSESAEADGGGCGWARLFAGAMVAISSPAATTLPAASNSCCTAARGSAMSGAESSPSPPA